MRAPDFHRVGPCRYVADAVAPVVSDRGKVGAVEHQDVRFHLHVDVAENAHVARLVERHRTRRTGPVGTEIELPGNCGWAEHVVLDIVAVGELDDRPAHHRQDAGCECQVLLVHHDACRSCRRRRRSGGLEIHHGVGGWPILDGGGAFQGRSAPTGRAEQQGGDHRPLGRAFHGALSRASHSCHPGGANGQKAVTRRSVPAHAFTVLSLTESWLSP
jgi:hypothetical protein